VSVNKSVTPSPANMTLPTTGVCPTPQPTASPTAQPTAQSWTQGPIPTPQATPACSSTVSDTSYVKVVVTFNAPVFVPFVGRYLESPAGSGTRSVSATQRMQIEPCTVTQGG
jgi:hypothetical protein